MLKNKKKSFNKIILISIIFSLFTTFLSSLRVFFTGYVEHFFINWNILLSLLSLIFAVFYFYAENKNKNIFKSIIIFLSFFLSFIFLPNSPYMITDSTHISNNLDYRWFDTVLFFSAGLSGILVYSSIIWIYYTKMRKKISGFISILVIIFIALLNSLGVFLGRTYQLLDNSGDRFNSWDLFKRPIEVLEKVFDVIVNPMKYSEFPFLFLGFSTFLIFISMITIYISKKITLNKKNN